MICYFFVYLVTAEVEEGADVQDMHIVADAVEDQPDGRCCKVPWESCYLGLGTS